MAKKLVINGNFTVVVHRDGEFKKIGPNDGAFEYTSDEIKDIRAAHGNDALREPKNEDPSTGEKAAAKPAKAEKSEAAGEKADEKL